MVIRSIIITSVVPLAVITIANPMAVVTRQEVVILYLKASWAQSVDTRDIDTSPAPGPDQIFRRRRSLERINKIAGIKEYYLPDHFWLSKE